MSCFCSAPPLTPVVWWVILPVSSLSLWWSACSCCLLLPAFAGLRWLSLAPVVDSGFFLVQRTCVLRMMITDKTFVSAPSKGGVASSAYTAGLACAPPSRLSSCTSSLRVCSRRSPSRSSYPSLYFPARSVSAQLLAASRSPCRRSQN